MMRWVNCSVFALSLCFISWVAVGEAFDSFQREPVTGVSYFSAQQWDNEWYGRSLALNDQVVSENTPDPSSETPITEDVFDSFSRPVTGLRFDHPFIWNELRPLFIHHEFPDGSILQGGNARVYGMQFWLKLTDRIGIIASKDGFIDFNPDALEDQEGWADLVSGLKINLVHDPVQEFALSVGGLYEWTQGSSDVFQGEGDGIWDFFLSAAKGCGKTHFIGTVGIEVPQDSSEDTGVFHYHAHFDYELTRCFSPLIELNGYHYLNNADRNAGLGIPLDFEGFDLTSFGSSNVEGNDIVTMGVGFRWKLSSRTSLGVAYEWPLTERKDLFEERLTCDLSIRF